METNGDLIMAVNYNSLKSLKGTSIGTIVPWCGDIALIPKGWVACSGELLGVLDYPLLYEIIGNRYGGTLNVSFSVPNFTNRGVVDYHTSHANIDGVTMPNVFKNLINDINDVANATVATISSNVDLRVDQVPYNTIAATITAQTLVDPSFSDAVYIAGRLLGDDHIATHSHPGEFDTVGSPSQWVEACQNNTGSNCFSLFECRDDCNNNAFYPTEANNPYGQSLFKGFPEGGIAIYQAVDRFPGSPQSPNVDFAQQNSYGGSGVRNYILPPEDPQSFNTGGFGYNTSLDQNAVNFINVPSIGSANTWNSGVQYQPGDIVTFGGYTYIAKTINTNKQPNIFNADWGPTVVAGAHNVHDHLSLSYDITKGSMSIPASYNINNIETSNVSAINAPLTDIGRIQIEVDTPVVQVMYIIRAY